MSTTTAADQSDAKTYTAMNVSEGCREDIVAKGTARRDVVKRILQNGWVNGAVCRGEYSDDYLRDEARDYGKGSVSTEYVIDKMETVNPEHCWVKKDTEGRQIITIWWSFQSYDVVLDLQAVRFTFDTDADSDEDSEADDEEPEPAGPPSEVFEMLETGDNVLWDGKSKPLSVTVGFEDATEQQPDDIDTDPTVWLEGPRGGTKRLRRSENGAVSVASMSLSSSPTRISGLRIVDE